MSRILMTIIKTFSYGSNRMMLQYATALRSAGHEVTVAYEQPPQGAENSTGSILPEIHQTGIPTIHLPTLSRSVLTPRGGALACEVRQRSFDLLISNQLRDRGRHDVCCKHTRLAGSGVRPGAPLLSRFRDGQER